MLNPGVSGVNSTGKIIPGNFLINSNYSDNFFFHHILSQFLPVWESGSDSTYKEKIILADNNLIAAITIICKNWSSRHLKEEIVLIILLLDLVY